MTYKLTCPSCARYTSALFRAYSDGRPCPYCGSSLQTASEQYYRQLPHDAGQPTPGGHMSDRIEITGRNDRGFHQYGTPVSTTYGRKVEVYESSAASGPHCWLRLYTEGGAVDGESMAVHLSLEQAAAIRDRLTAFIDEDRDQPQEDT